MNMNFNEICRLCLRFCDKYVDLKKTNGVQTLASELTEKINFCYLMQIDLSEELPTKVCYECIQVISFFYITKKNLFISEEFLRDILHARKKTKVPEKENLNEQDVIEINLEKKTATKISEKENLKETKRNTLSVSCEPYCMKTNAETKNSENSKSASNIKCDKGRKCANPGKMRTKFKQNGDCIYSHKNYKLRGSLCAPIVIKEVSVKLKDFKSSQSSQSEKNSKRDKDTTTGKETSKSSPPFKENVVKEITKIDTSNILSPNVKRTRRSVSVLKSNKKAR